MNRLRKRLLSMIAASTMLVTIIPTAMVRAEVNQNNQSQVTAQATNVQQKVDKKIVAYFPEWAYKNEQNNYYTADMMPWDKMTHVNYAFAHVDKDTNKIAIGDKKAALEEEFPGQTSDFPYKGHFNVLNSYKKTHPNVKTIISVGGWAESTGFFTMSSTAAGRQTFADSVVEFLRTYGFDGVDIDYEYPTTVETAGNPNDLPISDKMRPQLYTDYVEMMKVLKTTLDKAGVQDNTHYSLTAAVTASGWVLGGMGKGEYLQYLDFVNLMTYDFHGSWNGYVAHNSALYSDDRDAETKPVGYSYLSTDWAVRYYSAIMDPSKIVVGIPYYTRGWEKVTPSSYPGGLYGKAGNDDSGTGAVGIDNIWHDKLPDGTEEPGGSNPLWHVKNLLENKSLGYQRYWDDVSKVPYVWNEGKKVWLSFEDEQSMNEKVDYIVKNNLGGAMIWEIDGDFGPNKNYVEGSTALGEGKYTVGDTLTTIAKTKFDASGASTFKPKVKPAQIGKLDVQLVEKFDHPYNEYKINLVNNTGKAISGPYTIEFDISNSVGFKTAPYGLPFKKEVRGNLLHFTVNSDGVKNLKVGTTTLLEGDMTLRPATLPQNIVVTYGGQTYGSEREWANYSDPTMIPATVTASTSTSATGNYTVTASIPANSNGQVVELYEGEQIVKTERLDDNAKTITYNATGKTLGDFQYKAVVRTAAVYVDSNIATVKVTVPAPVLKPAIVSASTSNSTDGVYSINVSVPTGSNGKTLEIYEGTTKIKTETIDNNAKSFKYDFTGKASGVYNYKAVVVNGVTRAESNTTSVTVKLPAPVLKAPIVNVSRSINSTGSFKVTVNVPANSNGKTVELYQGTTKIKSETLDTTGKAFVYDIKVTAIGKYDYKAVIVNGDTKIDSNIVSVDVKAIATTAKAYDPKVAYTAGQTVLYNGSVYKAKWWTTGETPGVAPVWELVQPTQSDILDLATAASKYNVQKAQVGYEDDYDTNSDAIIDIFDLVSISKVIK